MYRKVYKLFLIMMLALMMVGGSFLVSMASSPSTDNQNIEAADSEDNQSKSDDQDGGSDKSNNDVAGGEEITSGGGTDIIDVEEPTIPEEPPAADVSSSEDAFNSAEISVNAAQDFPVAGNATVPAQIDITGNGDNTQQTAQDSTGESVQTEVDVPESKIPPEGKKIEHIEYEKGNHILSEPKMENLIEPSCESAGSYEMVVRCKNHEDYVISRTIYSFGAPLGHDMGEWKVVEDATPFKDGLVERHCLREGCSHTEKDTLYMVVVEPDPIEEEKAISYTYEGPSSDLKKPAILGEYSASTSASGSSSGSYRSRSNGSGVYTSSVSPSLPIAIESEEAADTNMIDETPIPDIIPPVTDFGSGDLSGDSGPISYLVLTIDILLALGLVVGLGALWKLGLLKR